MFGPFFDSKYTDFLSLLTYRGALFFVVHCLALDTAVLIPIDLSRKVLTQASYFGVGL